MLKERLRFLIKDTALYGVANAFSKVISFLTLPIIVKQIDASEFGIWNLLTIIGGIICAVSIFGMDSAVVRYYFDDKKEEHQKNIFSQGFFVQLVLVFFFILVGFIIPGALLWSVNVSNIYINSLYLILVWVPGSIFIQYLQNWFKWTFQRTKFLILSLGYTGINLVLLFIFFQFGKLSLNYILLVQAVSASLFSLVGIWWCRKLFVFKPDWAIINKLIIFGFPMMFVMAISILSPSLDRIFLVRFLDAEQLGIYSFGQKLSAIMTVGVVAFQAAFGPFAFSIWETPDASRTFSRFQSYYILLAGAIALGICSFGKPLIVLMGTEKYFGTEKYLPYLVLGVMIYGLYSFASLGIFYSKKIRFNLLALTIGIGCNVLFNFIFIRHFREYGAAAGFLFGNTVLVLIGYYFSSKYYKISFSSVKDFILILVLGAGALASTLTVHDHIWIDALIKSIIGITSFLFIGFIFLTGNEKAFIIRVVVSVFQNSSSKN